MLDELRQKPKDVREKYAFWGAFSITAVIALVWGLSLSIHMSATGTNVATEDKPIKPESAGAFSRSFSDIKSSAASAWSAFSQKSDSDIDIDEVVQEDESNAAEFTSSTSNQFEFSTTSVETKNDNARTVLIATTSLKQASSTQ